MRQHTLETEKDDRKKNGKKQFKGNYIRYFWL